MIGSPANLLLYLASRSTGRDSKSGIMIREAVIAKRASAGKVAERV